MWIFVLFAALALWTPDLSWEELERTYLRRPEDLRQVQGVRWHVRDDGTAQQGVWVLIHGFASDLQTWNAWAETLKATHRVIRVDLPGFGLSGPTSDGDYSTERQCQRLLALLDDLKVGREEPAVPVYWAGHSMGARLVSLCAGQGTRPPDAVVLIAPALGTDAPRQGHPGWSSALRWVLPKALIRSGLTAAHAGEHPPTDAEVERSYQLLRAPGVRDALLASTKTPQPNPAGPASPASVYAGPVLLMWGAQERLLGDRALKVAQRAWPQARLQTYAQAGHMVHEDAADASVSDALAFVKSLK